MRSSIPPCPGRIVPESFTLAPRLIKDSTRSPNCAATFNTADKTKIGNSDGLCRAKNPSFCSIRCAFNNAALICNPYW